MHRNIIFPDYNQQKPTLGNFFFLNDVLEAYQKTPQIYWIQDWERRQGKLNTERGQDSWIKN